MPAYRAVADSPATTPHPDTHPPTCTWMATFTSGCGTVAPASVMEKPAWTVPARDAVRTTCVARGVVGLCA